jgi:ABC-2 type transport system ATP-binding protein
MTACITVKNLIKRFEFSAKDPKAGWIKNLFCPIKKQVIAVDNISFAVEKGERVAFIGPNGAGKSTTIKMLTGILYPTAGSMDVLGLDPSKDRKKLAYKIGTVFGQRSQLLPNLPLTDSLEFFGVMYDMPDKVIKARIAELIEIFDLNGFIDQPVRKLSLGQRMRGELAASLMHRPEIVFLDEPTIGLDVVAKKALRDLLLKINKEDGVTIFLTSHDVGDIEALCERTMVINFGQVIKDLPTEELSRSFVDEKFVDLVAKDDFTAFPALPQGLRYALQSPTKITVAVDLKKWQLRPALKTLLDTFEIEDLNVYNAELEAIIRHIYAGAKTGR